jgi:hypothetical protein
VPASAAASVYAAEYAPWHYDARGYMRGNGSGPPRRAQQNLPRRDRHGAERRVREPVAGPLIGTGAPNVTGHHESGGTNRSLEGPTAGNPRVDAV